MTENEYSAHGVLPCAFVLFPDQSRNTAIFSCGCVYTGAGSGTGLRKEWGNACRQEREKPKRSVNRSSIDRRPVFCYDLQTPDQPLLTAD